MQIKHTADATCVRASTSTTATEAVVTENSRRPLRPCRPKCSPETAAPGVEMAPALAGMALVAGDFTVLRVYLSRPAPHVSTTCSLQSSDSVSERNK